MLLYLIFSIIIVRYVMRRWFAYLKYNNMELTGLKRNKKCLIRILSEQGHMVPK